MDAEAISEETEAMWRTMIKLTKTFSDQLSDELGSELLLTVDTSLADMVDCGLATILRRLEEISHAASKEFALEKALHRMKTEWGAVQFEFKPW
ncbi:hypothetical protein HAZT_HAZT001587, partial [Hyalella azteca]